MQTYLTLLFELVFATGGGALLLTFVMGLISLWKRSNPDRQPEGNRTIEQATERIAAPAVEQDTALEAATEVIDEFLRQPAEESREPELEEEAVEAIAAEVLAEAEPSQAEAMEAIAVEEEGTAEENEIADEAETGLSTEELPVEASTVPDGPDKLEDLGETERLEELGPADEKVPLEPIPMGKLKRTEVQKQQELVDETG